MAASGHSFSQYAGLGSFAGSGLPSSTIQASLSLDQPGNVAYTNLDTISGRVLVRCAKNADVSSIVVKLEGESRTRLMSPGNERERPKPELEYHKILYKVQTVFPPPEVLEGRNNLSGKASYTLPIGQHEYPFAFKLPFNNSCSFNNKSQQPMGAFDVARPPPMHIKKTLPPTLTGFPGEAEIRYFVKVTVNRHSVFKENPRAFSPFNFFPIEPPRPPLSGAEIFGRQRHTFNAIAEGQPVKDKMKSLFGKSSAPSSPVTASQPPSLSVDARLPEPAILTCNSDIPLRLLVKKLHPSNEIVILDSLQISLIGHTKVRAHDVFRTESTSWIIVSRSNMGFAIESNSPSDADDPETVLDDRLWRGQPLPKTIAPSFATCNIERTYQLDIRMGLSYAGADGAKPQSVILPIRLDTCVYSGIAPPPEVLAHMRDAKENVNRRPTNPNINLNMTDKLRTEGRMSSDFGSNQVPPTPLDMSDSGPAFPPRPGTNMPENGIEYGDAPPSYEDAIASSAPPVSAPRPDYQPPPQQEDHLLATDEKKG